MKHLIILSVSIFSICFLIAECSSPKKITYEFPSEMSASVKSEFIKQCDKGKILYDINCGGCHTTKVNKKEVIPDFTSKQLSAYELREKNSQHESNISETNVSAEELGLIVTFLNYKKKNALSTTSSIK